MKLKPPILCLVIAAILCGCTTNAPNKGETYSLTDDYGRAVEVPKRPQRIVSASPAITEIIFALGAENLLVGRTDFCTYPPEAAKIKSIGGISNLNVEKVISLRPDLIISGSMIPKKATYQTEKMGIATVCVIEQHTYEGLYDNIAKIGRLVGRQQAADTLIAQLRRQMPAPPADTGRRPSAYYVVGFGNGGNFTAGGNTYIDDLISMAGGRNIAHDIEGWNYSLEALLKEDPDYIVIRREDSATFCTTQPYTQLTAVKQGRVVAIESGCIDLQVPRNIECVKTLAKAFALK